MANLKSFLPHASRRDGKGTGSRFAVVSGQFCTTRIGSDDATDQLRFPDEDFWTTLVDDVRGPSRSKANRCPVGSFRFAHSPVENSSQLIRLFPRLPRYCRFACSALASFRMVMSESVSSTSTYARAGISGWLNRAHSRISLIREVTMGVRYSG